LKRIKNAEKEADEVEAGLVKINDLSNSKKQEIETLKYFLRKEEISPGVKETFEEDIDILTRECVVLDEISTKKMMELGTILEIVEDMQENPDKYLNEIYAEDKIRPLRDAVKVNDDADEAAVDLNDAIGERLDAVCGYLHFLENEKIKQRKEARKKAKAVKK